MYAQRRINEIVFLRQLDSALHLLGAVTVANGDKGLHPGLASASNDLLAIGVELLTIKMGVRINKH